MRDLKTFIIFLFSFCYFSAWSTTAFSEDLICYYKEFPEVVGTTKYTPYGPPQQFCRHKTEVKIINLSEKNIVNYSIIGTKDIGETHSSINDPMPPINPKQTVYKTYGGIGPYLSDMGKCYPPLIFHFWIRVTNPLSPLSPKTPLQPKIESKIQCPHWSWPNSDSNW